MHMLSKWWMRDTLSDKAIRLAAKYFEKLLREKLFNDEISIEGFIEGVMELFDRQGLAVSSDYARPEGRYRLGRLLTKQEKEKECPYGGVLEHPAYSDAWKEFDLPRPSRTGGWVKGFCGGWSCQIEQGRYGHPAKKATWLYVFNTDLPRLKWGYEISSKEKALVSWCRNNTREDDKREYATTPDDT